SDALVDVYVRDRVAGITRRVSVASNGGAPNGPSWAPRLSADGRYVAFTSAASNLVPGDTNGVEDVFVHDRVTHTTTRVSVSSDAPESDQPSIRPAINGDGSVVAFVSKASTLAPSALSPNCAPMPMLQPPGACSEVFVRDRLAGTTTLVSPQRDRS